MHLTGAKGSESCTRSQVRHDVCVSRDLHLSLPRGAGTEVFWASINHWTRAPHGCLGSPAQRSGKTGCGAVQGKVRRCLRIDLTRAARRPTARNASSEGSVQSERRAEDDGREVRRSPGHYKVQGTRKGTPKNTQLNDCPLMQHGHRKHGKVNHTWTRVVPTKPAGHPGAKTKRLLRMAQSEQKQKHHLGLCSRLERIE